MIGTKYTKAKENLPITAPTHNRRVGANGKLSASFYTCVYKTDIPF